MGKTKASVCIMMLALAHASDFGILNFVDKLDLLNRTDLKLELALLLTW